MPDRLTRLKSLAVTRVAFVGAGDNPDAHVLLWKSRNDGDADATARHAKAQHDRLSKGDDVSEVKKGPKQMTAGRLKRLLGVRDEIDTLLSEVDADREEVAVSEEHKELIEALPEDKRDDVAKAIAEAEARAEKAEADAKKAREEAEQEPEPEPDVALDKALAEMPAPVAKAIEDLRKRADDAETEVKTLRETVDASEEERKVREATEAAKALKALTIKPEEFGKVLAKLREDSPDSAAEVERVLAAANNSVGEFLTEIGKGGDAESEASAKLDSLAKAYKADHPDVTDEKAMAEVASTPEGRELRAEMKRGE